MAIKIFIDQGHNPKNPNAGAEGNGLKEQDITYKIGVKLAQLLDSDTKYEARLSRNSPDEQLGTSNSTSLAARVNAANKWGADYFISLHTNASSSQTATGVESYAFSRSSSGFKLGESIVNSISRETGFRNRGTFPRPSLYVLKNTKMPATLIEMGFITNVQDSELMNEKPELFANAIYQGIKDFICNG